MLHQPTIMMCPQHMKFMFFPSKQTSKPKIFLKKQTYKKPKKFSSKTKS